MAKRSLADDLMSVLPTCRGVTRVRNTGTSAASGKKKVKIIRGNGEVMLTVFEPDFPKRNITADTSDVVTTAWQVQQYLQGQKIEFVNK